MTRLTEDDLARLVFAALLDEDQLLDEMLDHPAQSERYAAALNELKCRGADCLSDGSEVGTPATRSF